MRTYINIRFFLTLVFATLVSAEIVVDSADDQLVIDNVIKQCSEKGNKYSCLANKAAVAMERAAKWDVPIFDGFTLARNVEYVDNGTTSTSRALGDGVGRLTDAVSKFLDSHMLVLDLTEEEANAGGVGTGRKKSGIGKKEKKYLQYALMVLLGVFGISGPLIMNALGLFAGKALIASKIALIIVGSVALKKIFQHDHHSQSTVKVHTHTIHDNSDDDHDRRINSGAYKFLNTMQNNLHNTY